MSAEVFRRKSRLNVLWLSHLVPYPPKSGVLMRSYHLLREMAKHHDVELFAFTQSRQIRAHFPTEERGLAAAREHLEGFVRRFHVEPIPCETNKHGQKILALTSLLRRDPYTINWLKSAPAQAALSDWLRERRYDLVHFDTISLVPFLNEQVSCPTVLDHHNVESHMMLRRASQQRNYLKRWYFHQEGMRLLAYEKRNLRRLNAHIACSEEDRSRLLEIDSGLDVHVVPNGIVFGNEMPIREPLSEPPKLLFIGGLDWYPNTDAVHFFLDEIWPLIIKHKPAVQFDVIGKKPTEKMLAFAKRDPRVRVHGFVDDIEKYYREAAVYVCPIRDGGGTKLKVIDALAHRVPLIGCSAACEGLDVKDDVQVRIADSASEFAEKTIHLITHPEDAARIGNAGYDLAKARFDFQRIGADLAEFYFELCASGESAAA